LFFFSVNHGEEDPSRKILTKVGSLVSEQTRQNKRGLLASIEIGEFASTLAQRTHAKESCRAHRIIFPTAEDPRLHSSAPPVRMEEGNHHEEEANDTPRAASTQRETAVLHHKRSREAEQTAGASPHEVIGEHAQATAAVARNPSPKRAKGGSGGETPPMKTPETGEEEEEDSNGVDDVHARDQNDPKDAEGAKSQHDHPVPHVERTLSSGSVSSDLSSSSASSRHEALSPIPPSYISEVPPAPPSTPASTASGTFQWDTASATTPLPMMQANSLLNASRLEQQMLAEGAATPAPTKGGGARTAQGDDALRPMSEDFSDWAVGERYEMVRILGRGSYGEVAQAIDRRAGQEDAFVAIKRIQSPFDQEVDAVRLYREIHILRQMRGHECIIQLVDVVQPPTEDLDDFHDLYLVFECTWQRRRERLVSPHGVPTFVLAYSHPSAGFPLDRRGHRSL
jgi:hypothetical protein